MARRWFFTIFCKFLLTIWALAPPAHSHVQRLGRLALSESNRFSEESTNNPFYNNVSGIYTNIFTHPVSAACPNTLSIGSHRAVTKSESIVAVDSTETIEDGHACTGATFIFARTPLWKSKEGIEDLDARYKNVTARMAANVNAVAIWKWLEDRERSAAERNSQFGYEGATNSRIGFEDYADGAPRERICGRRRYSDTDFWFSLMNGAGNSLGFELEIGTTKADVKVVKFPPFTRSLVLTSGSGDGSEATSLCVLQTAAIYEPEPASEGAKSATTSQSPSTAAEPSPPQPDASDDRNSEDDADAAACFPGFATAELASGARVPLSALRVGDVVRASPTEFSPVYGFTHRSPTASSAYISLTTAANLTLTLTPGHYLYASRGGRGAAALTAAAAVRAGDTLTTRSGAQTAVTRAARLAPRPRGLYNPHTLHGDIVVDGLAASTYTTAVAPAVAHAALAPARALYRLFGVAARLERGGGGGFAKLVPGDVVAR